MTDILDVITANGGEIGMGYDLYIVWPKGEKNTNREEGYFRLAVWGMRECRDAMTRLGMVDWKWSPGPWPKLEDFVLRDYPDEDAEHAPDSPSGQYLNAVVMMRNCVPESGLIAGYKLCTNDGWIVTPLEIKGALAVLDVYRLERADSEGLLYKFVDAELPDFFDAWLAFLVRAGEVGGFSVH